ncbi:MAG TPA: thioesterase family protein [Longimicrobiales bacterium]|nr:thioesterase family protein [Longimicrobiales bacterium]
MNVAVDGWFRTEVPVRFRDLDAMGHAHHTLPLIYLEEARAAFWRELKGSASIDAIDYVMAEITLRFHERTRYPANVVVGLAVRRVGAKSFTTEFEIRSDAGALLSSGTAVQVLYDYAAGSSKPIDAADRTLLERWAAAAQNSSAMPADTAPINPPRT